MEKYEGTKFEIVFLDKSVPVTKDSGELISWFRKFDRMGLAPEYGLGSSGNLSFRHLGGFVIKSTKTYFRSIGPEDLVFVERLDLKNRKAYVRGSLEPSTELALHHLIYENMKEINAVFHVHDYKIMEKARKNLIPITKETEAGTEKIGYDVIKCIDEKSIVIMKDHGIVSVGKSMKETGENIVKWNKISQ
ncbi:MAG TPA: class II aldolase/adducin family protein [Candidatus Nanoarchaeia archaeon]|nr:class II aldolase/adducin family protein [Candidatus Nanoarchaeia archaeon]